jgi:predicted GNAT family acetyltransferase
MITTEIQNALLVPLLRRDRPRVGPFVVLLDETSDNPFRNYAAPATADPPSAADVAELTDLFRAHERRPRLEYVEPNDAVTAALLAGGYAISRRLPLLVLRDDGVVDPPPVPDATVRLAAGRDDLLGAAATMARAYEDDEPAERGADRLQGSLADGGAVSIAVVDGQAVSAGLRTGPAAGMAEVAAVATLPEYRRRGLAAAVVAELSRDALAAGLRPYLQAESEAEARIYARLGFEHRGSLALADG